MTLRKTTLLLFVWMAVTAVAANRSETEMIRVAQRILGETGYHRAAKANDLRTLHQREMLTVIGHEQEGFVIVANDDEFDAVVGYSQNPFTAIPPAVEWYLDAANMALKDLKDKGERRAAIPASSEFPSSLEPLVKTHWDQGNPYNKLCPGGNGSSSRLYPTGCVATAISQVMKFHQYPKQGTGEHQYSFQPASGDGRIIYANFGETTYDWDNMLDEYKGAYTEEQANAVATLMLHCGVAVDMSYTASGSGAYGHETCKALKTYFGYNKNTRLYTRDYYTAEAWMKMIYTELNQYGPIYYAGTSQGQGGHAFVLDGYDETGLVHINWGWGGKSDGYYDIALLNPTSYEFSLQQEMILYMDPDADIPYESQVVATSMTFTRVSNKSITISGKVYNASAEKFTGVIGCVVENLENGSVTELKKTAEITMQPIVNGTYWTQSISLPSNNVASLPNGTYRLYVASRAAEDTKWQLVRPKEGELTHFIVTKSDDDIKWETRTDDLWSVNLPTAIQSVSVMKDNSPVRYFDLQGREVGKDARGLVIMKQGNVVKKVMK